MDLVVQQLVNAISLGGVYALLALGLAIVFSIMGLVNFAHGEIMTLARLRDVVRDHPVRRAPPARPPRGRRHRPWWPPC